MGGSAQSEAQRPGSRLGAWSGCRGHCCHPSDQLVVGRAKWTRRLSPTLGSVSPPTGCVPPGQARSPSVLSRATRSGRHRRDPCQGWAGCSGPSPPAAWQEPLWTPVLQVCPAGCGLGPWGRHLRLAHVASGCAGRRAAPGRTPGLLAPTEFPATRPPASSAAAGLPVPRAHLVLHDSSHPRQQGWAPREGPLPPSSSRGCVGQCERRHRQPSTGPHAWRQPRRAAQVAVPTQCWTQDSARLCPACSAHTPCVSSGHGRSGFSERVLEASQQVPTRGRQVTGLRVKRRNCSGAVWGGGPCHPQDYTSDCRGGRHVAYACSPLGGPQRQILDGPHAPGSGPELSRAEPRAHGHTARTRGGSPRSPRTQCLCQHQAEGQGESETSRSPLTGESEHRGPGGVSGEGLRSHRGPRAAGQALWPEPVRDRPLGTEAGGGQ